MFSAAANSGERKGSRGDGDSAGNVISGTHKANIDSIDWLAGKMFVILRSGGGHYRESAVFELKVSQVR